MRPLPPDTLFILFVYVCAQVTGDLSANEKAAKFAPGVDLIQQINDSQNFLTRSYYKHDGTNIS